MEIEVLSMVPLFFIASAAIASVRAQITDAPEPLKILSKLWLAMLLVEIAGHFTRKDEENYWLYNCFHLLYYPVLANIYSYFISNEKVRASIQVFYWVFVSFFLCNTLFIQGIRPLQTMTLVFGGCFIIFLGGSYFWQLFNSNDNQKITADPFFWLSFGLILYFGGTVPFLGMFNYLKENFFDFAYFYFTYVYNAFAIILNIIIVITFLCKINYPKLS
jgi:hypothetical protein